MADDLEQDGGIPEREFDLILEARPFVTDEEERSEIHDCREYEGDARYRERAAPNALGVEEHYFDKAFFSSRKVTQREEYKPRRYCDNNISRLKNMTIVIPLEFNLGNLSALNSSALIVF